jgi:hypothetical protein
MVAFLLPKKKKKKKKSKTLSHLLGIILAIAMLSALAKHSVPHLGGGSGVHSTSLSGTLDCSQLEQLWEDAGGSSSAAFTAAEVARAESSGEQYATDDDGNGTEDFGYWQINTVNYPVNFSPMQNAEDAVALYERDGWYPWVTWKKGLEIGQC